MVWSNLQATVMHTQICWRAKLLKCNSFARGGWSTQRGCGASKLPTIHHLSKLPTPPASKTHKKGTRVKTKCTEGLELWEKNVENKIHWTKSLRKNANPNYPQFTKLPATALCPYI